MKMGIAGDSRGILINHRYPRVFAREIHQMGILGIPFLLIVILYILVPIQGLPTNTHYIGLYKSTNAIPSYPPKGSL